METPGTHALIILFGFITNVESALSFEVPLHNYVLLFFHPESPHLPCGRRHFTSKRGEIFLFYRVSFHGAIYVFEAEGVP